jgi:hypothetical protein
VVELSYEFKNSGFPARPSSRLVHSMFTHSLPSSAQSKDCSPKRSTSSEMSHCGSRQSGGCVTVVVVVVVVVSDVVVLVLVVEVVVHDLHSAGHVTLRADPIRLFVQSDST